MRRWDRKKQDTENTGKKNGKRRWAACIPAVAAFALCACGGGRAGTQDAGDISLYDRGLAVIDIMAEMTESEAYIGLTTANDGIRAIIQNDLAGEHEEPEAVYFISIPEEQLRAWWDLAEMEETGEMSQELWTFLRQRILASVPSVINGMAGVEELAAANACMAQKTFAVKNEIQDVTYLYVYEDAAPAAVTFTAGEDGTVSASGTFLLQDEFSCGSAAEIEAFFEGIGVEAEVGEILPEE
ncbi:MAG TPA: hypothetical protein H9704_04690 [Candidatus Enterocloster excrementipullorum]|uniref:Uncharacterized protein n=1 Tax=Candidatus Enterocloster excrementipullorum TaxID=2838559 RepID=A0A9D2SGA8_9FIRM|nr:hypothetical protein [Candidatus Enterocloster excrementipullorum]